MAKKNLLVIDDEKDILKLLQYNLEKEGYSVFTAETGEAGLEIAQAKKPDLIILDLMLPKMDGLEVCRLLRAQSATKRIPVVMLTAKGSEIDQVVGLEIGATDYVSKPFSVKVLLARIKNIFRNQSAPSGEPKKIISAGPLEVDREKMIFSIKGKPVPLTKLEFNIAAYLMENRGKAFSRDQLLSGAWQGEAFVVDRTVDVHIKSLRKKLGKYRDLIETVRGTGYRFSEANVV